MGIPLGDLVDPENYYHESQIAYTADSLISVSWADLHITRHPVSTRRLGLLANHRIQQLEVLDNDAIRHNLCGGFGARNLD